MHFTSHTPADLCRHLADGWTMEQPGVAHEFIDRLRRRWLAGVESERPGASSLRAVLEVDQIHLLGASELGCLVLGNGAEVEREVGEFWQQHGGGGRLALILAATTALKETARRFVPAGRCAFLGNGELESLLTHAQPLKLLKEHLRQQIPLSRLLPYDITHPVAPNMFYGRRDILKRFHQEETTSFAIAGPGRIGKSSLLKQYARELKRNRDGRYSRLTMIDCYPFAGLGPDALARSIAFEIGGDSHAANVTTATLLKYLKYRFYHLSEHKPLELLLDEVDGVCRSEMMEDLAEAVRVGYCRVILCGKGNLYALMRHRDSQFAKRLELLRPEPLDEESAGRLLFEPLADLGLQPQDREAMRQSIFDLTGRRPHLIQESAKILFQFLETEGTPTITAQHLSRLREKFMEMSHTMLPLADMQDDLTRLLVLLWLREGGGEVTVGTFQRLAGRHDLALSAAKTLDICDDLWICNVLLWEGRSQALASSHLVEFVRKMDFSNEISRLKLLVTQRQAQTAQDN